MIHPRDLVFRDPPPIIMTPGLHKRTGLWGFARGVVLPVVHFDRMAEGQPGSESLLFHEGLHAYERHALAGLMLVGLGLLAAGIGVSYQLWGLAFGSLLAPLAYAWWRREAELRADAFALRGAGSRDFLCFVSMHPHPTGWFWRWCYGANPGRRYNRAVTRAARHGWEVRA